MLTPSPPEILIDDGFQPCPYLPGQLARLPVRQPIRHLFPEEFDERLAQGDRRYGPFLYTVKCHPCKACQPLRINTSTFQPSPSQKRSFQRAQRVLRVEKGPLLVDQRRLELFERHRLLRGLKLKSQASSLGRIQSEYTRWFIDRLVDSFEIRYFLEDTLVGVAITDAGKEAWSAVYTYYDPKLPPPHHSLSIGTFSIITQIYLAKEMGVKWVYLGFAIAENEHMRYKLRFLPHERLIDGNWVLFER
ncbi:MAG: arginyltransferase [Sandaracinaceae bacterium]|nr:arginyltransferase [Sandaracinaceae bacterium]MDW8245193.1 arginyltransferase [Sandaracinaceae bacterium]